MFGLNTFLCLQIYSDEHFKLEDYLFSFTKLNETNYLKETTIFIKHECERSGFASAATTALVA